MIKFKHEALSQHERAVLDQAHAAQPGYRELYLGEEHPDQISIQCKTSVRQEASYFPLAWEKRR